MDAELYMNVTSDEINVDDALSEEILIRCYESETFQKFQYTVSLIECLKGE